VVGRERAAISKMMRSNSGGRVGSTPKWMTIFERFGCGVYFTLKSLRFECDSVAIDVRKYH
jgi:hypothetical protein